ncbi:MAG: amidinotransferase [Chitinophagaceae bacterium]|nr:amidinotransferase [Chitinophagaceae bacterium]
MIKPVAFDFNAETAVNNAFQQTGSNENAQQKAEAEFDGFVQKLTDAGVDVTVVKDTPVPHTPDSIFPNNWISFHWDGTLILYPMYAVNRRAERKAHVVAAIASKFEVSNRIDLSSEEANNKFLEGTGSMVLDRPNKIAYACLSPRTDQSLFEDWCNQMAYHGCSFHSVDETGGEIYHTNVMICVADKYVVICSDSIRNAKERAEVINTITNTGKEIIEITYSQMNRFAGNMLQVENKDGKLFLVMSSQAYHSLTAEQLAKLESHNPIIHSDLTTIETNGGGSARCMMAEVFLPAK